MCKSFLTDLYQPEERPYEKFNSPPSCGLGLHVCHCANNILGETEPDLSFTSDASDLDNGTPGMLDPPMCDLTKAAGRAGPMNERTGRLFIFDPREMSLRETELTAIQCIQRHPL